MTQEDHAGAPMRLVEEMVERHGLEGAGLALVKDGRLVVRQTWGVYTPATRIPVASASKWFSVAVIMALVDEGVLSLDAPLARHIPAFTGQHALITLRQALACTSGLPSRVPWLKDTSLSLKTCVERMAGVKLIEPPGTALRYGGCGFQAAARAAEAASGQSWAQLFQTRLAVPLGLGGTVYGNIVYHNEGKGRVADFDARPTANPHIGGGVATTLDDYARFLLMLAGGGVFQGRRVLGAASVDEMFRDQTAGLDVAFTAHGRDTSVRYGLGTWIHTQDDAGNGIWVSDQGALGCTPWLDRATASGGVLMVKGELRKLYGEAKRLMMLGN